MSNFLNVIFGGAIMRANTKIKTDPELLRQINAAGDQTHSIEAVFSLNPQLQKLGPREIEAATYEVLQSIVYDLGYKPQRVSIFEALGSFVIFADAPFLRRIIEHPDIASAIANSHPCRLPGSGSKH